jgi:hypothetical protein
LNVISNDVATVKFVYEDDFNMTFKPRTNESSVVTKEYTTTTETTETNSYKVDYGKYLKWENKFEPKLAAEFNVAEPLKLKAQLALPVTISQEIDDADKYESVTQKETFNRQYGYTSYTGTDSKKTITGESPSTAQNSDVFKTVFAPKLSAGFVYEVTPGKFNVNFGASAQPKYTWTTTTKLNPNVNTVTTTESKDTEGNVTTSKTVAVVDNNATDEETKVTAVTTTCDAEINLGATWFFTENVNFDVYFLNTFGTTTTEKTLFDTSKAGASVTVKF